MAKKRNYLCMARTPKASEEGIQVGDKHIDFHGKSAKIITDPTLADDIDKTVGLKGSGEVWIHPDEMMDNNTNYHDGVHKYFFGAPTSRKYRDNYDHIFNKNVT
jgi:hypothetical protein